VNALPTSTPFSRLLVGFASESGNARALAQRLGAELQPHGPQVLPFNDIDVASLGQGDVLLAISSSFGDGEPPRERENAITYVGAPEDEIVGYGHVHVERMNDGHIWANLCGIAFDFYAKRGKIRWVPQATEWDAILGGDDGYLPAGRAVETVRPSPQRLC